jgi:hypothetical protein
MWRTQLQSPPPDIVSKKLDNVINKLHNKLASRISYDPSGYEKALAVLEKTVEKLPDTVDTALQKCLYGFGKSVTQVIYFYFWGI